MPKKQTSVDFSSFGSGFIEMKLCWKYLQGLQYKLRMVVIPYDVPFYLCNNSILDSTLEINTQSIAYHLVCEVVTRD